MPTDDAEVTRDSPDIRWSSVDSEEKRRLNDELEEILEGLAATGDLAALRLKRRRPQ